MDLGILNKRALVTGGCNGIGRQLTLDLLEEGCYVTATTRSLDVGEEFINSLNKKFRNRFNFLIAELSSKAKLLNFINTNKFDFDILINNAGHTLNLKSPNCSMDEWESIFTLNFLSVVKLTDECIPYMRNKKWGRIVNITSCAGFENSGPVTYTCSKSALTAYTRTMGRILAVEDPGIVMTAVYPGVIKTKGGHWEKVLEVNPEHAKKYLAERCPLGRFGETSEFSPTVIFFCSNQASFAHGTIVGIDGGQSRHFLHANYEP
jgi:NAD(P)-dependent dehydrogenase (short-subunit alcohol dehydrogenase family)